MRAAGFDPRGELWAMTLDAKRTFDDIIERERRRTPRSANAACSATASTRSSRTRWPDSQEYMAMEKLHELHQEPRSDLLVLDQPPWRDALDSLDATERAVPRAGQAPTGLRSDRVRGGAASAWLAHSTGLLFSSSQARDRHRPADGPVRVLLVLRRDVRAASASGRRAGRVSLLADHTHRVPAGAPGRATPRWRAVFVHPRLLDAGLPFGGVIVNRMRELPDEAARLSNALLLEPFFKHLAEEGGAEL